MDPEIEEKRRRAQEIYGRISGNAEFDEVERKLLFEDLGELKKILGELFQRYRNPHLLHLADSVSSAVESAMSRNYPMLVVDLVWWGRFQESVLEYLRRKLSEENYERIGGRISDLLGRIEQRLGKLLRSGVRSGS